MIEFFGDSRCYQHKRQLLVVKEESEGLRIPWDRPWATPQGLKSDWLTQGDLAVNLPLVLEGQVYASLTPTAAMCVGSPVNLKLR